MCGIVGYVGSRPAKEIILAGLRRLEYRGYDRAGSRARRRRDRLDPRGRKPRSSRAGAREAHGSARTPTATIGIGHTRWATHGGVTEENAHPLGCSEPARPSSSTASSRTTSSSGQIIADGATFSLRDRRRGGRAPDRDGLRRAAWRCRARARPPRRPLHLCRHPSRPPRGPRLGALRNADGRRSGQRRELPGLQPGQRSCPRPVGSSTPGNGQVVGDPRLPRCASWRPPTAAR